MRNRFIINEKKNTILDTETNLEWKRDWSEIPKSNFKEIRAQITENLAEWHIPSRNEYKSLSQDKKKYPSAHYLKKVGFKNVKSITYWTSDFKNKSKTFSYWICFDFYFFSYSDFKGNQFGQKTQVTLVRRI